jgi:hypothetical protein
MAARDARKPTNMENPVELKMKPRIINKEKFENANKI